MAGTAKGSRLRCFESLDVCAHGGRDREHSQSEQEPHLRSAVRNSVLNAARGVLGRHAGGAAPEEEEREKDYGCDRGAANGKDAEPVSRVSRAMHTLRYRLGHIKTKATTRSKLSIVIVVIGLLDVDAREVSAEPLRLRGDALVQSQSPAPVGLLSLYAEDRLRPWLDVETVTWLGITDSPAPTGDVLSLSVRARDPKSGSELRAGRMLVTMGALRPIHIDGMRGLGRAFGGTTLELFGGVPVVKRFEVRTFDVAAGGRVAQAFADRASVGASYLHRWKDGARDDEEVGADAALTPAPWFTAAGRWSFDLTSPGTADALGSISVQGRDVRTEIFTTYRSPGRLLPSTSLFSVLGDIAATSVGATARYRLFPRLEVVATGSGQAQGDVVGGQGLTRVTLALDDDWAGSIGIEVRRVDVGTSRWTGLRAVVAKPLSSAFRLATELEFVRPDEPHDQGSLWPWVLGALGYRPTPMWDFALGVEAASGREYKSEMHALLRATYEFEGRRP